MFVLRIINEHGDSWVEYCSVDYDDMINHYNDRLNTLREGDTILIQETNEEEGEVELICFSIRNMNGEILDNLY